MLQSFSFHFNHNFLCSILIIFSSLLLINIVRSKSVESAPFQTENESVEDYLDPFISYLNGEPDLMFYLRAFKNYTPNRSKKTIKEAKVRVLHRRDSNEKQSKSNLKDFLRSLNYDVRSYERQKFINYSKRSIKEDLIKLMKDSKMSQSRVTLPYNLCKPVKKRERNSDNVSGGEDVKTRTARFLQRLDSNEGKLTQMNLNNSDHDLANINKKINEIKSKISFKNSDIQLIKWLNSMTACNNTSNAVNMLITSLHNFLGAKDEDNCVEGFRSTNGTSNESALSNDENKCVHKKLMKDVHLSPTMNKDKNINATGLDLKLDYDNNLTNNNNHRRAEVQLIERHNPNLDHNNESHRFNNQGLHSKSKPRGSDLFVKDVLLDKVMHNIKGFGLISREASNNKSQMGNKILYIYPTDRIIIKGNNMTIITTPPAISSVSFVGFTKNNTLNSLNSHQINNFFSSSTDSPTVRRNLGKLAAVSSNIVKEIGNNLLDKKNKKQLRNITIDMTLSDQVRVNASINFNYENAFASNCFQDKSECGPQTIGDCLETKPKMCSTPSTCSSKCTCTCEETTGIYLCGQTDTVRFVKHLIEISPKRNKGRIISKVIGKNHCPNLSEPRTVSKLPSINVTNENGNLKILIQNVGAGASTLAAATASSLTTALNNSTKSGSSDGNCNNNSSKECKPRITFEEEEYEDEYGYINTTSTMWTPHTIIV